MTSQLTKMAFGLLAIGFLTLNAAGQPRIEPMAVYVLEFQTDIKGDNATVARDMSVALETAMGNRHAAFRVLERRDLGKFVQANNLENELQALARGQKPSQRFVDGLKGAEGLVRGELLSRVDGITLTVSLTRLNSEKVWQGRRRHSLYEWLNGDLQQKDAEGLAAEAAAALLPAVAATPKPGEDTATGIRLAVENHCSEAMPFLENAAVVDSENAELFFEMGRCQNKAKDFSAALRSLTKAASLKARSDIFAERARSFLGNGLNRRALDDLDEALKLDERNLSAVELRGDIWMQTGRYDDAVSAFYEVEQQDPNRERCLKLAEAYRKNGATGLATSQARSCASAR